MSPLCAVISLLKGLFKPANSAVSLSATLNTLRPTLPVLTLVYFALKYLPMRPHVPHMQDADELDRHFSSLHSHCLLLRCNLAHSSHAMISLRKSLSSHLIPPRRSAAPKDSKDREDDDTSRSRLLLMLDLLVHRAFAREVKAAELSEPQSLG